MMPFAFLPNLGGTEMIIVAVVCLLIFGNRLPSVMRSLGKSVTEFKKGVSGIEDDIDQAVTADKKTARPSPASDRRSPGLRGRPAGSRGFVVEDGPSNRGRSRRTPRSLERSRSDVPKPWPDGDDDDHGGRRCSCSASGSPRSAGRWAGGSSSSRRGSTASATISTRRRAAGPRLELRLLAVLRRSARPASRPTRTPRCRSSSCPGPSRARPRRPPHRRPIRPPVPQMEYPAATPPGLSRRVAGRRRCRRRRLRSQRLGPAGQADGLAGTAPARGGVGRPRSRSAAAGPGAGAGRPRRAPRTGHSRPRPVRGSGRSYGSA